MFFYFDEKIKAYEECFQWEQSLLYLERRYLQRKECSVLNALVGYSWLYFTEGPIISGEYENDANSVSLEYWIKYLGIGKNVADDNPYFNFVAGYTLFFSEDYLDSRDQNNGKFLMEKCASMTDDLMLKKLAHNFIQNINSKKHVLLKDGNAICAHLFSGNSLLEQYFCEIYTS